MTPRQHLGELFAKLDAFFVQAQRTHGKAITCHPGCTDCCMRRFSVTSVEAAALVDVIDKLPLDARQRIRDRALRDEVACPLLDEQGRCTAYAARPAICRTHGLPIRFAAEPPARSLPMIDACPKNFTGIDLTTLNGPGIMEQATASTILAAIDAAHADALGIPRGERTDIVDICRDAYPE